MAPWSMQEKNRKQEELDDWLTFPVHAVAVDPEAVVLMVSCACDVYGELPDGCPRFHPTGTVNRAELQYLAGSPKRRIYQFKEEEFDYLKKKKKKTFTNAGKKRTRTFNKPVRHVQF